MGDIADGFSAAWRDFVTDGVPGSGPNEPDKAEIRALGATIESYVADLPVPDGSIPVAKLEDGDEGDLLIGGDGGAWEVLPAGTDGARLVMEDGRPAWSTGSAAGYYDSGFITYANGTPTSFTAHSLGGAPDRYLVTAQCTDASGEHGYSQNDVTLVASGYVASWYGVTVRASSTNIQARPAVGGLVVFDATGQGAVATAAKWKIRIQAWRD